MNRPCSCGKRILNPIPIAIQEDRGVPLLILHNCPFCHSTRAIPWHMATDAIRAAAQLAEDAVRPKSPEMTVRPQ